MRLNEDSASEMQKSSKYSERKLRKAADIRGRYLRIRVTSLNQVTDENSAEGVIVSRRRLFAMNSVDLTSTQ